MVLLFFSRHEIMDNFFITQTKNLGEEDRGSDRFDYADRHVIGKHGL